MLSEFSYPIICTDKFVETVNFYEDYLHYTPALEQSNYVILKRNDWDNCYLAILDISHPSIPQQYRKQVSGMLLNYPVANVDKTYEDFYWEGLNIVSDLETTPCYKKRFFIEDPNGILIAIGENAIPGYSKDDLKRVNEELFATVNA